MFVEAVGVAWFCRARREREESCSMRSVESVALRNTTPRLLWCWSGGLAPCDPAPLVWGCGRRSDREERMVGREGRSSGTHSVQLQEKGAHDSRQYNNHYPLNKHTVYIEISLLKW